MTAGGFARYQNDPYPSGFGGATVPGLYEVTGPRQHAERVQAALEKWFGTAR